MKILIVDDHNLFREGLLSLLSDQNGLSVVGEVGSVSEAVEKTLELNPDLVLMDISLPDGSGIDAVKTILSHKPKTLIVMLTVHESDEMLFATIRNGAVGYILKNTTASTLINSLKALERGEAALSRTMTRKMLDEFKRVSRFNHPGNNGLSSLTDRELQVLKLLEAGSNNREIAARLVIAENTAKVHVHNVMKKLGCNNRRQAGEFAYRHNINPQLPKIHNSKS